MDVTRYLEKITPAPCAVIEALPERRSRPRFMIRDAAQGWRAITWGAFAEELRAVAMFLHAVGLSAGEHGAVFSHNRVAWLSAALGVQAAGGVLVPIYPSSTAEQMAYIVGHSDAAALFVEGGALLERVFAAWGDCHTVRHVVVLDDTDPLAVLGRMRAQAGPSASGHLPSYEDVRRRCLTWSQALTVGRLNDAERPGLFERLLASIDLDQPALLQYTSGTTGNPKGVPLTHRNVGVNGHDWLRCNGPQLDEQPVDLLWLPLSHVFGFGEACLGNTLGFTTYWCEPQDVLPLLPEVRPSVFMSVPRLFEKLATSAQAVEGLDAQRAQLADLTGGRLRFLLSGGAGLKREVKELFLACGLLVTEGYGLTEASPTLTLNRHDAFRFDSVGKPLPSVEVRLADDGEILARGPNIFRGYHKDAEATAAIFTEDGWLKTGDIGRWTEDGFLQIIDRKKEILVTAGGKNIPPANIEVRFQDSATISHLVVYGDGKPFLTAAVWLTPGAEALSYGDAEALVQAEVDAVNGQLPRYEQIKRFVIIPTPLTVEGGLLTPTLKVKRKKVYEAFHGLLEGLYGAQG
jgi:long-chain acyl-CoA synthetase